MPCSITSYGDRENTWEEVSEYFRCHFIQVQKRKDSSKRALYVVCVFPLLVSGYHRLITRQQFSSMLDVEDSRRIILHGELIGSLRLSDSHAPLIVNDSILRQHLAASGLSL
jgi:hypothetical protein